VCKEWKPQEYLRVQQVLLLKQEKGRYKGKVIMMAKHQAMDVYMRHGGKPQHIIRPQNCMEVSGKIHCLATLPMMKEVCVRPKGSLNKIAKKRFLSLSCKLHCTTNILTYFQNPNNDKTEWFPDLTIPFRNLCPM